MLRGLFLNLSVRRVAPTLQMEEFLIDNWEEHHTKKSKTDEASRRRNSSISSNLTHLNLDPFLDQQELSSSSFDGTKSFMSDDWFPLVSSSVPSLGAHRHNSFSLPLDLLEKPPLIERSRVRGMSDNLVIKSRKRSTEEREPHFCTDSLLFGADFSSEQKLNEARLLQLQHMVQQKNQESARMQVNMALGPFLAASESFLLKDDKELHSSPCATEDTVYTTEVVHKPFKINTVVPIVKGPDSAKTVVDKDTDDEPKPQKLRFQDDMYTPEWVRYAGPLKQGLCEQCTPPKWLQLRNSAYWYHKLFFHGISATTGKPFTSPQNVRIVWTIGPNKPGEQVCHVYLHVEGYCFNCCKYLVLNKTRRRSVGTADPKQMRQKLTTLPPGCPPDAGPRVLSEDPLTITATVTMHGSIYVPPPLCVNEQMEAELLDIHKNQQQMTVWYRHAYKCHPQEQSSKPKSDKRRKKSVDVVIKNNNLR